MLIDSIFIFVHVSIPMEELNSQFLSFLSLSQIYRWSGSSSGKSALVSDELLISNASLLVALNMEYFDYCPSLIRTVCDYVKVGPDPIYFF